MTPDTSSFGSSYSASLRTTYPAGLRTTCGVAVRSRDSELLMLCDDLIATIAFAATASERRRYIGLITLQRVCKCFQSAVGSFMPLVMLEAEDDLFSCHDGGSPLLNLSSRKIDRFACEVLAIAMAHGRLTGVRSLWLQNNLIDCEGLNALSRGLREMPTADCQLCSLALGANRFFEGPGQGMKLDHALKNLQAAARARRVVVRLRS